MFCFAGSHAFAPHPEAGGKGVAPHEFDHFLFSKAKLNFNGLEGRAVFPCHLNDAVFVLGQDFYLRIFHKTNELKTAQAGFCYLKHYRAIEMQVIVFFGPFVN
jgi:hypothetical protein